jgi:hypothetical protein
VLWGMTTVRIWDRGSSLVTNVCLFVIVGLRIHAREYLFRQMYVTSIIVAKLCCQLHKINSSKWGTVSRSNIRQNPDCMYLKFLPLSIVFRRSHLLRRLRRESAAACMLDSRVRIPPGA